MSNNYTLINHKSFMVLYLDMVEWLACMRSRELQYADSSIAADRFKGGQGGQVKGVSQTKKVPWSKE